MNHWSVPLSLFLTVAMTSMLRADDALVYFGSHSTGPGKGFSVAHFDTETGVLGKPEFMVEAPSPAFFVISPDGRHLYTCNSLERFMDQAGGGVSAYSIDPASGKLTFLNSQPAGGGDTSHCSLDHSGKFLLAANYNGGNFAIFALNPDGSIGKRTALVQHSGSSVDPRRQTHAYAHCIKLDPTNHFVLVTDLGVDQLFVYRFDETNGTVTPIDPPSVAVKPGSGPRHISFHPNGKWLYLVNEMASTVYVYAWDSAHGVLSESQTISTLPDDFKAVSTTAEIEVHPNGKFLYVSNRGEDAIAMFSIDQQTGKLARIGSVPTQGKVPRNFAIDPSGKWMIVTNQDSSNAIAFKIDPATGKLTQNGQPVAVPSPFCERFYLLQK
jgi:6-phosphogluconolactonase